MGVIIQDEDDSTYHTEFTPFDDSNKSRMTAAANLTLMTNGNNPGIDTSGIDAYRQGVEITNNVYRFSGTAAKIWSGNIKGYSKVTTLGQSVSFTEFEGTKIFEETQTYNPISYVNSTEEIYFANTVDDIPVDNSETILAPFTIKNRFGLNKGYDPRGIYGIRGNLEDGNQSYYTVNPDNSIIEQFIIFNDIKTNAFFNDCENTTLKQSTENKLNRLEQQTKLIPFFDINFISSKINTSNTNFINLLVSNSNDINLDEDIREKYNRASSTAGYNVYGPSAAQYGTDSIAFNGLLKGN